MTHKARSAADCAHIWCVYRLWLAVIPPWQDSAHRDNLTTLLRLVACDVRQGLKPRRGLQQLAQVSHGGLVERRLQAHQVVVLLRQGHKVKPGLLCRGGNAKPGIALARGHGMGHGSVRGFGVVIAIDLVRGQGGASSKRSDRR